MSQGFLEADHNLIYDKILGCLIGVGIGDAMGMPTEFLSPCQIREHFGEVRTFQPAPDWHPLAGLPAGSMTDDTQQTLLVSSLLIEKGRLHARDVADALLRWAEEMNLDNLDTMGPSTSYALKRLRAGDDPRTTGLRGNTNGAAMRIAPVGCAHAGRPGQVFDDVLEACSATHLTDVAIAGASAIACGVAEAIRPDADVDAVLDAMTCGAQEGEGRARREIDIATSGRIPWEVITAQINPSMVDRLRWALQVADAAPGTPEERRDALARAIGTGVAMIETVPFAAGLVRVAQGDPYQAIVLAASAGGDTDTLASIVGGLCGALRGAGAFPAQLVEEFRQVNMVSFDPVARGLTDIAMRCRAMQLQGR